MTREAQSPRCGSRRVAVLFDPPASGDGDSVKPTFKAGRLPVKLERGGERLLSLPLGAIGLRAAPHVASCDWRAAPVVAAYDLHAE